MRITRDHVPQPPRQSLRVPEDPTLWVALALLGAALACSGFHPVLVAAGVAIAGVALYRLGRIDARRPAAAPVGPPWRPTPEEIDKVVAEVRREHDAALAGPAPGDRGGPQPEAPAAARPSAAFRGGGVPGRRGPAAPDPLDAPVDHADRTLTSA